MIRKAELSDVSEIRTIYGQARSFMRSYGNEEQWTGDYPENMVETDIENGVLYVYEDNGEVLGALALIPGIEKTYGYIEGGSWKNDLPYATIHRIAVSSKARGTNVAKECIDFGFHMYGNIRVDTYKDNIPMQKFLKKNGFEWCGTIFIETGAPRMAFHKTAGLVLASQSPRRKSLMRLLDKDFCVCVSDVEEIVPEDVSTENTAEYLSGLKADDVYNKLGDTKATVIGSDTIVDVDGVIYGKPVDEKDAYRMLRTLSGRSHYVRTGVTILRKTEEGKKIKESFTSVTKVSFFELTDGEINAYIATGKPMDKAGAYGIQDGSELFVSSIEGGYFSVVGFPIGEISRRL